MKYEYRMGANHPSIKKLIETEQFKISEQILELRNDLGLSIEEAAKISDVSFEEYFDLEWAEIDIPVVKYKEVLRKLERYCLDKPSKRKRFYRESYSHFYGKSKGYGSVKRTRKNDPAQIYHTTSVIKTTKNEVERDYVWH